jgi:hypothetical protein
MPVLTGERNREGNTKRYSEKETEIERERKRGRERQRSEVDNQFTDISAECEKEFEFALKKMRNY